MGGAGQVVGFLFEAGQLKRVKRSGWWHAHIRDPESVAEHSYRTGLAAYLLALMEGEGESEAGKIAVAALAHDLHEARTTDLHKISAKYFDKHAGEGRARKHQGFQAALSLTPAQQTIVKDADLLEMALQAKEYADAGNAHARHWLASAKKGIKTASAKRLHVEISRTDSAAWWKKLGKRASIVEAAKSMGATANDKKTPRRAKAKPKRAAARAKAKRGTAKEIGVKAAKAAGSAGAAKLPYKYWRWGSLPKGKKKRRK